MENLKSRSGILEDYLLKNEKNNMSKTVKGNTKNSKFASLDYEVLKYNEEIDLLETTKLYYQKKVLL